MNASQTVYALYPVFASSPELPGLLEGEREAVTEEIGSLFGSWEGAVQVRGVYSCTGFRPDADLMLWLVGSSADDLQRAVVNFRKTRLGSLLDQTWSFMGVVKPAEFSSDHQPAFVRGERPGKYLCVYPFVRTPQWYLLPKEERAEYLREHGVIGREFPDVLANTTSAFGLGDWEWILAFESERLDSIVDCIRKLRDAKARLYTKEEVPFVTGIRKEVSEAVADLV